MLSFFVTSLSQSLSSLPHHPPSPEQWAEIEATLHCLRCAQEALPMDENEFVPVVFSEEILGRLPKDGESLVKKTMLALIGSFTFILFSSSRSYEEEKLIDLTARRIRFLVLLPSDARPPRPRLPRPCARGPIALSSGGERAQASVRSVSECAYELHRRAGRAVLKGTGGNRGSYLSSPSFSQAASCRRQPADL
jgi:hypothetical protein